MQNRLVLVLFLLTLTASGCGPLTLTIGRSPSEQRLTRTTVTPDGHWGSDRIALIDVTGIILNGNRPGLLQQGVNPVSDLYEKLQAAARDDKVKAVVLRINSPGGGVNASRMMYQQVMDFKNATGKQVVVAMMDVAASGGYYLALAGDHIVAAPTTVTGSVGVLLQTISFKKALNRWGIEPTALTSGANKDAGSPLSELSEEQRQMLQGIVDDFYGKFVALVRLRRPMIKADRIDTITDGRIFTGDQALSEGLVDQVGDFQDAVAAALHAAGLMHADLVMYHREFQPVASPYAFSPAGEAHAGRELNIFQINLPESSASESAGFYYLWRPQGP